MIVTPRPPMSAVQFSSGTGRDQRRLVQRQRQRRVQPAARAVGERPAGLAGDVPGQRADQRRRCWPPRRPAGTPSPASRAARRRRTTPPGRAAAAAAGWLSHPSAGMIELVIEVRVRSLVVEELRARRARRPAPASAAAARGTSWAAWSLSATHSSTSPHRRPAQRGGVQQRREHPAGLGVPALRVPDCPRRGCAGGDQSVARSIAVTGSAQPASGSNGCVVGRSRRARRR